jgi:hypothetical protein
MPQTVNPLALAPQSEVECAQAIADLIVHDGMTWALARDRILRSRRKAPPPHLIESAVRQTFAIFYMQEHAQELRRQRMAAVRVLDLLGEFRAFITGAVLNGAAGPDSTLIIEVFEDNPKAVEIAFLDAGVGIEAVTALKSLMPEPLECLGFLMPVMGRSDLLAVRVNVQASADERLNPSKRLPDPWQDELESRGRLDVADLRTLIAKMSTNN